MTLFEVLKKAKIILSNTTPDYDFDAWVLFSYFFGMTRSDYFIHSGDYVDSIKCDAFFDIINERKDGKPLQYIVGKWNFLDNEFYVGDGVLIPRADTECLVEKSAEIISQKDIKIVYDLCSGTGCIGISLAKMFEDITVFCLEKSNTALSYLKRNVELNGVNNVKIIQGDIFDGADKNCLNNCELIVSNPPYIKSEEIKSLQKEVQFEPVIALDGGNDGLSFYRALKDIWFDKIENCRHIIMECGEDQADDVAKIFSDYGNISFIKDLNNISLYFGCAVCSYFFFTAANDDLN